MLKLRAFNNVTKRWRWMDAPLGSLSLRGPYPVDFSDFEEDGDEVILFTPIVDSHILDFYGSPSTLRDFVCAGADPTPYMRLGQTIDPGYDQWAELEPGRWNSNTMNSRYLWNSGYFKRPDDQYSGGYVGGINIVDDTPVRVKLDFSGGEAPTVGHVDFFFVVAVPVLP